MGADEPIGNVEFAVLDAVHRGALRSRRTAQQIPMLREQPSAETVLHEVLHRCERDGLLRSGRDSSGRWYELTPAGRAQLRAERKFRAALLGLLVRRVSTQSPWSAVMRAACVRESRVVA
jgi:DNA-binding PadR family transcriptional regulator